MAVPVQQHMCRHMADRCGKAPSVEFTSEEFFEQERVLSCPNCFRSGQQRWDLVPKRQKAGWLEPYDRNASISVRLRSSK